MPQSTRGPTLADRVAATRHRFFVGRAAELDLFRSAISAPELPWAVLAIHGPGGTGKSTLLAALQRLAEEAGIRTIMLDARALDPTPAGILAALRHELALPATASPFEALAGDERLVLLIDTFEMLAPLESWIRETMLPQLPADSLTVLAGRNPPEAAWRTTPGWDVLVHTVSLRNLAPEESRTYLRRRGVPDEHIEPALAFTHGHPLALSLVADLARRTDTPFDPANEPDVVRTLLEKLIQHEPSPQHRRALELAAHTRVTSESMLAEMFGDEEGHRLFAWLSGLSFMEHSSEGLSPHDLVREIIEADLRRRHPNRFLAVHRDVHRYVIRRIRQTHGKEQVQELHNLMFLHRNNPAWRPYHAPDIYGRISIEPATAADTPLILDMVQRHEGEASVRIAQHWLARQPHAFRMVRAIGGEVEGFVTMIMLHATDAGDRAADPALDRVLAFIDVHGAVRPGEQVPFIRYALGNATVRVPSTPLTIGMTGSSYVYTHDDLAWLIIAVADAEFWTPFFRYVNIHRAPEADFEIGGRTYAVFAHDWRVEPIEVLDEILTAREISTERDLDAVPPPRQAPLIVLSHAEFAASVRQALRAYVLPGGLAGNPLLRSRLVVHHEGAQPPEERLRALIREAVAALSDNAKTARFARAVHHTYISPAPTQERAAELLDLPFSTYRRHLASGIEMVTASLWQREIGPTT